jgi:probable HAF family extracellular repeat protein
MGTIKRASNERDIRDPSLGKRLMFGVFAGSRKQDFVSVTVENDATAEDLVFRTKENVGADIVAKINLLCAKETPGGLAHAEASGARLNDRYGEKGLIHYLPPDVPAVTTRGGLVKIASAIPTAMVPYVATVLTLSGCGDPARSVAPRADATLSATASAGSYTVRDLGNLGGTVAVAFRVNEAGQVTGWSTTATGEQHGFRWTAGGGMVDLGTLPSSTFIQPFGINDQGDIVGEDDLTSGSQRAVLWPAGGGIHDLGTLGGPSAIALGINNQGEVVGFSTLASGGPTHGFVWTAQGGMKDVGTFQGTNTRLRTIDNAGTTGAGSGNVGSGGQAHAVLWSPTTGFQDLGTLGGAVSYAARINDRRVVVGFSFTPTSTHAFRWTQATGMVDLGALNGPDGTSEAIDVSDGGQAVGSSTTEADPANSHAVLWNAAGSIQRLPEFAGETDSEAFGLNEVGNLVGFADTPDGRTHALLWVPAVP